MPTFIDFGAFREEFLKIATEMGVGQFWENIGGPHLAQGGSLEELENLMAKHNIPENARKKFRNTAQNDAYVTARSQKAQEAAGTWGRRGSGRSGSYADDFASQWRAAEQAAEQAAAAWGEQEFRKYHPGATWEGIPEGGGTVRVPLLGRHRLGGALGGLTTLGLGGHMLFGKGKVPLQSFDEEAGRAHTSDVLHSSGTGAIMGAHGAGAVGAGSLGVINGVLAATQPANEEGVRRAGRRIADKAYRAKDPEALDRLRQGLDTSAGRLGAKHLAWTVPVGALAGAAVGNLGKNLVRSSAQALLDPIDRRGHWAVHSPGNQVALALGGAGVGTLLAHHLGTRQRLRNAAVAERLAELESREGESGTVKAASAQALRSFSREVRKLWEMP